MFLEDLCVHRVLRIQVPVEEREDKTTFSNFHVLQFKIRIVALLLVVVQD